MSKAYDEIMEKIVLNDDMRCRILQNLKNQMENAEVELQTTETGSKPQKNPGLQEASNTWKEEKRQRCKRRYQISKHLSAVACLVLMVAGVVVIPQINRGQQEPTVGQEMVDVVNGMETVASAAELSQKLGFPVSDLKNLPFTVEHTEYTNGWGEFAQIDYEGTNAEGDAQSLCYRKGIGTDDISGDYNEYEIDETVDTAGTQVTLKGSADGYALAVWNADGYAYAVSVTKKIKKDEMLKLVEEIMESK